MRGHKLRLEGQRFGRLLIISEAGTNKYGVSMWNAVCDCGMLKVANSMTLRNGGTRSCGCLQGSRHGHTTSGSRMRPHMSPEYRTWTNMQTRCYNPKATQYADYGGRGITIADIWRGKGGFTNFLAYIQATIGLRPEGKDAKGKSLYSIDRWDNDGNYEPGNIRWATRKQQTHNRRNSAKTHELRAQYL